MAKTERRPARGERSKAEKGDRKVTKAAKGAGKAKPPRGKPARPEFGAGPRFGGAKPAASKAGGRAGARAGAKAGGRSGPKAGARAGARSGARPAAKKPRRTAVDSPRGPGGALRRKVLEPRAPADQAAQAARAPEERPDPSRPRALAIAQAALDKKAEDVLVLDVRGLTSYADYFVLLTADSERQAAAIADSVEDRMKQLGSSRVGSEGYESGRWILIDYGDVVAHVMSREARGFYDLEGLWADAPRFAVAG